SRTLADHTCDPEAVVATARELLDRFDPQVPVRLVGVGMAGLAESDEAPAPARPASNGLLFG
ncbi:MAG: hypothetical protein WB462_02405, partial [Solirubrobacterales bacterium]